MLRDRWIRDPAHGQTLPQGIDLGRFVHYFLHHLTGAARMQIAQRGVVDFAPWITSFADQSRLFFSYYVRTGQARKARELIEAVKRAGRNKSLRKSLMAPGGMEFGWDLYRPEVSEWIRQATFSFAKSTLETAATDANKALQAFRESLRRGLERGDATEELNGAIVKIFQDPYRAARVAQSEASRAIHQGQMEADIASGIVSGEEWRASSDACELCLSLNGKKVKFGEPFYVWPKPGPYQMVYHPPLHPHCFCTTISVIDMNLVSQDRISNLSRMAYGFINPRRDSTPSGIGW